MSVVSSIQLNAYIIFALIPDGASVVILIDPYNKPIGNVGVANVDSHNLKSLCGLVLLRSSIIFSRVISHSGHKWTLANKTQLPFKTPSLNFSVATFSYPYPKAITVNLSLNLHSLAKLMRVAVGSVPCDKININGVVGEESRSTFFKSNVGGTVKLYWAVFKLFLTKLFIAWITRSSLKHLNTHILYISSNVESISPIKG